MASGWFTPILEIEASHSSQILLSCAYYSFPDHVLISWAFPGRFDRVPNTFAFFWASLRVCWSDRPDWRLGLSLSARESCCLVEVWLYRSCLLLPWSLSVGKHFWCKRFCFFGWLFFIGSRREVDYPFLYTTACFPNDSIAFNDYKNLWGSEFRLLIFVLLC